MAPTHHHLLARGGYRSHSHFSGGAGGGIGIGVILIIVAIIFICVAVSEYDKAKKRRALDGTPIPLGRILGKAALISCTLGLAACLCAEACGDMDNGGGNTVQQPQMGESGGGGFVADPMVSPPPPSFQPQEDWTPQQSAAMDGIQG